MYEQFLKLSSRPFYSAPAVEQFVPVGGMKKALCHARLSIDRGNGPMLIIGGSGVGKSLLLTILQTEYQESYHTVELCARLETRQDFLQTVLFELQLPFRGVADGEMRLNLLEFLRSDQSKPNGLLLLADDADQMSVEVLDELRVVANYVQSGQPRARLMLAGTVRLEELLADSQLQSLNQRISARCYLSNLSQSECADYVLTQIKRVHGDEQLFDSPALESIHELTDGCPRTINQLCDHALILCMTHGLTNVSQELLREAWADLQCFPDVFCLGNGAAKAASSPSTPANENWSIIEFGSLDDAENQASSVSDRDNFGDSLNLKEDLEESPPQEPSHSSPHWAEEGENCTENVLDWEPNVARHWPSATNEPAAQYNPYESCTHWSSSADKWNSDSEAETAMHEPCSGTSETPATPVMDGTPDVPTVEVVDQRFVATNPFAESFEEIESVNARFAPLIAHYNRTSQEVTSQDLRCLESLALHDPPESHSRPHSIDEMNTGDVQTANGVGVDSNAVEVFEPSDDESGWEQPSAEPFFQVYDRSENVESIAEPSANSIESEAEALIQQLCQSFGEPIEKFNALEGSSPEQTAPGLGSVTKYESPRDPYTLKMANLDCAGVTVQNAQHCPIPPVADLELAELESLKKVIEEQNRFSAQAFGRVSVQPNAIDNPQPAGLKPADLSRPPQSITISVPLGQPPAIADDRDMLVCEPSDPYVQSLVKTGNERIPFPPTPVSTGRAARMDYELLFNQLRNLPNP